MIVLIVDRIYFITNYVQVSLKMDQNDVLTYPKRIKFET